MTKYTVAVEDKQYKIDITKKGNEAHFTVKVDDKPYEVELLKNKLEYEAPLQIKIREKTYIIQINKPSKQAQFLIKVKDTPIKAEVKTQLPSLATKIAGPQTPMLLTMKSPVGRVVAEGAVTAPMAGKIVSVKVKKGDFVKAGEVLCILEAMKMENEIVAPKTGIIQEVNISKGATVNEGDILIILKSQ